MVIQKTKIRKQNLYWWKIKHQKNFKQLNVVNLWFMHKSSSSKPLRLLMENLPVGWGICLGPGTRGGAGGHAPLDTGNRVISSEVKAVVKSSAMKTSGWKSKQHTYISRISDQHWCHRVLQYLYHYLVHWDSFLWLLG